MQGGGHLRRAFDIVRLAVGDQHRTGYPRARLFGQRLGQRRHQLGPGIARAIVQPDNPQVGVAARRHLRLQRSQRAGRLIRPVADALARGLVHDGDHDVAEALAVLDL